MQATSTSAPVREVEGATDAGDADLQLLSSSQLRLTHWINTALASIQSDQPASASSPSLATSGPSEAAAVERLYVRVKAHERSVEAATEDYIRLSLSRLPRATMELEQMVAETERVTSALQRLGDTVDPAIDIAAAVPEEGENKTTRDALTKSGTHASPDSSATAGADGSRARHERELREKRMRELNTLKSLYDKLKRCADTLERATRVEEQIRRLDQGIRDFQERSKSSHFGSVLDLAKSLEAVQRDFTELRRIEPQFGERHQAAVEQYEGFVELALEEACLRHLEQHDVQQATTLFHTLSAIGRADAVLTAYVQNATRNCVGPLEKAFLTTALENGTASSSVPSLAMTADEAISQLQTTLLPHLLSAVDAEAAFLAQLATSAASGKVEAPTAVSGGGADEVVRELTRPGAETAAGDRGKTAEMLSSLLVHVSAKFEFAIKPLLTHASTTNEQRIRLYETVRQAVVGRRHVQVSAQDDASSSTATCEQPPQQQQQLLTAQMLSALVTVFHQKDVLDVFCANLDASAVVKKHAIDNTSLSAATPVAKLWDTLWQCLLSLDALTTWVDKVTLEQALRYFPDQVLPMCLPNWRETMATILSPVLGNAQAASGGDDDTQAIFLVQFVLLQKEVKPRLERAKQSIDDQLCSATIQQRYPAGVVVVSGAMGDQLWGPLLAEVEAHAEVCQRGVQLSLLEPVFQKTEGYTALPNWVIDIPSSSAAATAATAAAQTVFLTSHAVATVPLRELGEAIMELPLALESLSSLDVLRPTRAPPDQLFRRAAPSAAADGTQSARLSLPEVVEELASFWLDGLVQGAVKEFLENKFGCVRIRLEPELAPTATLTADQKVKVLQLMTEALQQLQADLEYLLNVLSAVSEEPFTTLVKALETVQTMIPATEVKSFTIRDVVPL